LLAKVNRILARLEADDARKAAKQAAANQHGGAADTGNNPDSGSSL
jgi:hypothetical protein